jgi:PPOX class probable F420-dependent enzyme
LRRQQKNECDAEERGAVLCYLSQGTTLRGIFHFRKLMCDERVKHTMPFQLPDKTTPFGQRVVKRLQEELVIWLTTIDSKGTPQPAPVWYWWDDKNQNILIYSMANAKREANLHANPRVSLNFDGDKRGGDIIVLAGKVEFSDDPPASQHQPYVEKYNGFIKRSFGTPENFAERYPVALRIQLLNVRGH